jgi:2-succinyl-6-hydroxy-2,4-cyclohexadiene-1-carboxylate synthase
MLESAGSGKMSSIFLHGNVGIGEDWSPVLDALPDALRERAFAPTLWGYFSRQAERQSFEGWAQEFRDSIIGNDDRPLLVGYSLGGRLALHALVSAPDCFSGAVIVSSHTGLPDIREREARLEQDRQWATRAAADWDGFLRAWQAQPVFDGDAHLDDRETLTLWQREIALAFDAWSLGRQENLQPLLGELALPVLWVSGRRDHRFSEIAARATGVMKNARHVVVDDAGHRVPWGQPSATAGLITEFWREIAFP